MFQDITKWNELPIVTSNAKKKKKKVIFMKSESISLAVRFLEVSPPDLNNDICRK